MNKGGGAKTEEDGSRGGCRQRFKKKKADDVKKGLILRNMVQEE